jgi:hypothetical protein
MVYFFSSRAYLGPARVACLSPTNSRDHALRFSVSKHGFISSILFNKKYMSALLIDDLEIGSLSHKLSPKK